MTILYCRMMLCGCSPQYIFLRLSITSEIDGRAEDLPCLHCFPTDITAAFFNVFPILCIITPRENTKIHSFVLGADLLSKQWTVVDSCCYQGIPSPENMACTQLELPASGEYTDVS